MPTPALPQALPAVPPAAARGRLSAAFFLAGYATFSLLYCVQPLLPSFSSHFGLSPAASALALSLATGALAISILLTGAASQSWPRRGLMFASMACAALLNIVAAVAASWPLLLVVRLLEGLALGGVPAVAMAYLAEETDAADLDGAMGRYVAGTAFGAMMGRVGMGLLLEWTGWQTAMAVIGGLGLLAAGGFLALLPPARRRTAGEALRPADHLAAWRAHLGDAGLLRLFAVGFVLTGVFVALFNYIGFRLAGMPYALSPGQSSLIFLTYALGMCSASAIGRLARMAGRRRALAAGIAVMAAGVLVTLAPSLAWMVAGVALVAVGFFIAHAVASSWVGRLARSRRGHASALYLLSYYAGASVTGVAGGWAWQAGRWPGVVALACLLSVLGLALALSMREAADG